MCQQGALKAASGVHMPHLTACAACALGRAVRRRWLMTSRLPPPRHDASWAEACSAVALLSSTSALAERQEW